MPVLTRPARQAGLLVAAVLLTSVTACGGDNPDLPQPPASPPRPPAATPTSHLSPEDAEAAVEILAAFDAYMEAYIELTTAGVPGGVEDTTARLDEAHLSDEAWFDLWRLLNDNFDAGHATAGTVTWSAHVVEIDWEHVPEFRPDVTTPRATLEICFDETAWTTVDVESGAVVEGPRGRYLATVLAKWWEGDSHLPDLPARWEIVDRQDGDETC